MLPGDVSSLYSLPYSRRSLRRQRRKPSVSVVINRLKRERRTGTDKPRDPPSDSIPEPTPSQPTQSPSPAHRARLRRSAHLGRTRVCPTCRCERRESEDGDCVSSESERTYNRPRKKQRVSEEDDEERAVNAPAWECSGAKLQRARRGSAAESVSRRNARRTNRPILRSDVRKRIVVERAS